MPRGVYDRSKAKPRTRKAAAKTKTSKFTKGERKSRAVNQKPVNKKVVQPAEVKTHMELMDVPAFLAKLKEVCNSLREASAMTTHTKEAELLMNFAICIERQLPPKYLNKEIEV